MSPFSPQPYNVGFIILFYNTKQRLKESLKNLPSVSQLERAKIDLCQTTNLSISMTLRYLKTKLSKTRNKLFSVVC